jgi:hypothetical protein
MNMKIEFVREVTESGTVRFFTEIDGEYVSGTMALNESDGRDLYQVVLKRSGKPSREILESTEVQP